MAAAACNQFSCYRAGGKRPVTCLTLLVAIVLSLILPEHTASAFILEGSVNSYAQYPRWEPATNGSLDFLFSTTEPDGLLMYTDNEGSYQFFQLTLVEGTARLRYNLGSGARLVSTGRNLNDGFWHHVRIQRRGDSTDLIVDSKVESHESREFEQTFGTAQSSGSVFFGGIAADVPRLTMAVVVLQPRFMGKIKDVTYRGADGVPRRPEMTASQGVRSENDPGPCGDSSSPSSSSTPPCQHNGRCVADTSRAGGRGCDCSYTDFEGDYCERERSSTEVTLRGREYMGWELRRSGGEPLTAHSDRLTLSFKTRHPAGLLFFTGDGKDYVNVALKEGAVTVTLDMGGDPLEVAIRPDKVRFDDNRWHVLRLDRRVKEINGHTSFCSLSVSVDGLYDQRRTTAGPFNQLASSRLHLGGADHPALLPGAKTKANFVGCLRNVVYQCDGVKLRLLQMAREQQPLLQLTGRVQFQCQEVAAAEPLSFTTKESLLILPSWTAPRQGSISFKLRTSEPDGLLLYNPGVITAQGDFFALEMMDGQIYLHLNLGSGSRKVKVTIRRVDDARWHEVTYSRDGRAGVVSVDEIVLDFAMQGDSHQLDLGGNMYVGGIGSAETMDGIRVPPELWMGRLGQGYVGCMRDLVVNGHAVDLASYAKKQDSGSILQFCHNDGGSCESEPCLHGGSCTQGWGRYICDCTNTAYVGPTCGKNAASLNFNGSQGVYVTRPQEDLSQAEEISFRFSTSRPSGLLLRTWAPSGAGVVGDSIEIALITGQLRVTVRIGDRVKEVHAGHSLNDARWHRVRYSRRASALSIQADNDHPVTKHITSHRDILRYQNIYIGQVPNSTMDWLMSSMNSATVVSLEDTRSGGPIHSTVQPFVGEMQGLVFNGKLLFEMARSGHIPDIQVNAQFGKMRPTVHHPVTFKTTTAFVALPQLRSYASIDLYFQFKTIQASGVIMYNAGKGHDFLAVELVNGHIHLVFNLGSGPIRLRDTASTALNDNQWHSVTVARPSVNRHTLMVDDSTAIVTSSGNNRYIDLQGYLYLGQCCCCISAAASVMQRDV